MGMKTGVSAVVLVAAACVYFATRTPEPEARPRTAVEPMVADMQRAEDAVAPAFGRPAPEAEARRQRLVAEEPPGGVLEETPDSESAVAGTRVLRVVLEGITEEDARLTTVTLTGVDQRAAWPGKIQDSWPSQGLTSEFDLDPFFATVEERDGDLRDELEVAVDHPLHLVKRARIPLAGGVELESGQTVYEVRMRLVLPVFWPELTLAVRDMHTREHLEDVELRCVPTAFMASQRPEAGEPYTMLGDGLSSPIVLLGGREADGPEDQVAGLALQPAAGMAPQLADLSQPEATDRGVLVYARAPGYAWSTIVIDVSTGAERELLLAPAAAVSVRLENVQLERYAALETEARLSVVRLRPDGGENRVWSQGLDETLEFEELQVDALEPGDYAVTVQLGATFSWRKRPVLAREELTLAGGEVRDLVLALTDPPEPSERATLGGVVSFPAFGGEDRVRLQLYEADYRYGGDDIDLSLADMTHLGDTPPSWAFRLEELPVGLYQVQLRPFLTQWMIELPAGGREDVKLVIPDLAEVIVETVSAETGERIPLEAIRHGSRREDLPGQVTRSWSRAEVEEPGRFRFWTAPGEAFISTLEIPSELDYGHRRQDLVLVPGLQSVRLQLEPVYAIRFDFRVGGVTLPRDDPVWEGVAQGISAVDHEGYMTAHRLQAKRIVEVSTPGAYEISFEGIGADRFVPILPRIVDVRPGETVEVIVELQKK